jgi:hypothetical protein
MLLQLCHRLHQDLSRGHTSLPYSVLPEAKDLSGKILHWSLSTLGMSSLATRGPGLESMVLWSDRRRLDGGFQSVGIPKNIYQSSDRQK